ncbi:MAG: sugar nucleotide-binding protein, partial [Chthoniobacterales bacterium]|nr:sugar nucleotide-binding protein [Chthoniobacterales bacterium]
MMHNADTHDIQIWGGVEPTINRVGDEFFSQFEWSGHDERLTDLEEFARLGLRTLRFPILWEAVAPDSLDALNWSRIDAQVHRLQELGIRPIAGLLHHGSGPRYTSLVDPEFPQKLAAFAGKVAERYPWVDAYTPINEPLTTARFSGLYGHWYPHGRDEQTFARCLLNQCRGVVLAMRAIRAVNPAASLVQTDDLGKTYSTPKLQYQADFENKRRWLTWDLLTGKLERGGAIWNWLRDSGIAEHELLTFEENPCPPDLIGVNHYITSERFLDEKLDAHPAETHGGNGRDTYADVAAVRARREGISGVEVLLREAWERYHIPLAITEAHLGCTREEQLRWLHDVWNGACKLRNGGVDVRAVTVWSLLGAFDWNSLLTRKDGVYEPGVYDLRGGSLRPTAIASMVHALAGGGEFEHPALATPGWWRRNVRLLQSSSEPAKEGDVSHDECLPNVPQLQSLPAAVSSQSWRNSRPILITGAGGRLAQGFVRAAELRGLAYALFSRAQLDIADESAVAAAVDWCKPWAIINCAGFSRVDDAEIDEDTCLRSNTRGAATLAAISARTSTQLVTFSSDHVFDGSKREPYIESDDAHPLNAYGGSKLGAEREVLATFPDALIVRPGKVFTPLDHQDFLQAGLRAIARGEQVHAATDIQLSGAYLPDLVNAVLDLLVDG